MLSATCVGNGLTVDDFLTKVDRHGRNVACALRNEILPSIRQTVVDSLHLVLRVMHVNEVEHRTALDDMAMSVSRNMEFQTMAVFHIGI